MDPRTKDNMTDLVEILENRDSNTSPAPKPEAPRNEQVVTSDGDVVTLGN